TNEKGIELYKGAFFDGSFNGNGVLNNSEGKPLYQGEFKNNVYEGEGTLFAADGTSLYKGFFKNNLLYPQGFLGISRTKLEEIEGKPTDINVDDDPTLPDALLSNYNDLQLSFILKLSPTNPKESSVMTVIISGTNLMTQIYAELKAGYTKGNIEDVGLKQPVNDDLYTMTYKIDDALFAFYFNSKDNTLNHLEIR
ncbi:MAG: hypothetical protein JWM44_2061, partial [Bacilli bacterium]|nr:hypothetical protein [Bacilli bacterium]